jgi:hypothetical protein
VYSNGAFLSDDDIRDELKRFKSYYASGKKARARCNGFFPMMTADGSLRKNPFGAVCIEGSGSAGV